VIRVVLPAHLRALARVDGEVQLEAGTVREALAGLEAAHPALRGTMRDPSTEKRRAFVASTPAARICRTVRPTTRSRRGCSAVRSRCW
jgi:hypothetical protein